MAKMFQKFLCFSALFMLSTKGTIAMEGETCKDTIVRKVNQCVQEDPQKTAVVLAGALIGGVAASQTYDYVTKKNKKNEKGDDKNNS